MEFQHVTALQAITLPATVNALVGSVAIGSANSNTLEIVDANGKVWEIKCFPPAAAQTNYNGGGAIGGGAVIA